MNNEQETNLCTPIPTSGEGEQLRAIAETLQLVSDNYDLACRLRSLSNAMDAGIAAVEDTKRLVNHCQSLDNELRKLRALETEETEMLIVVIDQMRKNGSRINAHSSNFRESLRSLLKHLTVRDEDGVVRFDDTNKLSQPSKPKPEGDNS